MKFKGHVDRIISAVVLLLVGCIYVGYCFPVKSESNTEDIKEVTITPKLYIDRFSLKKEKYETIPSNGPPKYRNHQASKSKFAMRNNNEDEHQKSMQEVKSKVPGQKKMWENDDEDEEYGVEDTHDQNEQFKMKNESVQACKAQDIAPMPTMLILHAVDMLAMDIPVQDPKGKKEKSKEQKGGLSESDSQTCGKGGRPRAGVKNHWRVRP